MNVLKRITTFCLILVVLAYTTPLQQFLKVPAMLEHYKEHTSIKPGITFLDFIVMHYIGDDGVADDESKDMQLPFKKSDRAPVLEAYTATVVEVCAPYPHQIINRTYPLFTANYLQDPYTGALLKPPQA